MALVTIAAWDVQAALLGQYTDCSVNTVNIVGGWYLDVTSITGVPFLAHATAVSGFKNNLAAGCTGSGGSNL